MTDNTILATLNHEDFDSVALGIAHNSERELYKNGMRPTIHHPDIGHIELGDESTCSDAFNMAEAMSNL